MAADQSQSLVSANNQTSVACRTLVLNIEDEAFVMMPQGTAAALDHNAAAAPGAASNFLESNLLRVRTLAGTHNSIYGSAKESSRVPNSSLIPSTNDVDHTPTHKVRCSLTGRLVDCAPLQLQVPAVDNKQFELAALQDDPEDHCNSCYMDKVHGVQLLTSEKAHASIEGIAESDEGSEEKEEVLDEEEEEEGCVTPTAKDQRIPEYCVELNESGLVCPPAPKKKPTFAAKRRRLFYSAIDADADVNFHVPAAERRAFLVDPPDLHTFPECIRALFK